MAPGRSPDESDQALLALAARAVRHGLTHKTPLEIDIEKVEPSWRAQGAAFVTLHKDGALRGCIGSILPHRPVAQDVAANAFSAAFRDTRFPPVGEAELPTLEISVSLLSPMTPIAVDTEDQLRAALRPHVDGLLIQAGERRAVFLPQVWEQLPEADAFLGQLKRKAGLGPEPLPRGFKAFRFAVREVGPMDYRALNSLDES